MIIILLLFYLGIYLCLLFLIISTLTRLLNTIMIFSFCIFIYLVDCGYVYMLHVAVVRVFEYLYRNDRSVPDFF